MPVREEGQSTLGSGKLWLVPSPIGNLADMTYRAVSVLQEADAILCEDTRTSGVLLKHYGIQKSLWSYHLHNEHQVLAQMISRLKEGQKLAMLSDAGTPGISDPGYLLLRECLREGIDVECLPGATAFVPALLQSGLPANSFLFEGFLPVKKGRQTALLALAQEERTTILYESPHRLVKTLRELALHCGTERTASVSRELTKLFEETRRGSLAALVSHFEAHPPKGEIVIVLAGKD
ncbi:MAG: 16S rRNA (cytidine(1402)-2'-O)-methyltransferase [Bacteroidetes bacterium]|nr:16S rRNA (cytidine(1402)-2'-O)-methyltransferase [Bacteroidota bacterium]MBS1629404.1 16S rRNA (cytidine(1402)-2'-O)-methyltransferase [Bacteroidota bacterium]